MARPGEVRYGLVAFAVAGLVGLASALVTLTNRDAYVERALRELGLSGTDGDSGIGSALVSGISTATTTASAMVGLLAATVLATMSGLAWQGYGWARIVLWVLTGLGLFGLVGAVQAPLFVLTLLGVLQMMLLVTGAVLLALGRSTGWYRITGRRRAAGLPG